MVWIFNYNGLFFLSSLFASGFLIIFFKSNLFFGVFLLSVCFSFFSLFFYFYFLYIEAAFPVVGIQNTGEINLCLQ